MLHAKMQNLSFDVYGLPFHQSLANLLPPASRNFVTLRMPGAPTHPLNATSVSNFN